MQNAGGSWMERFQVDEAARNADLARRKTENDTIMSGMESYVHEVNGQTLFSYRPKQASHLFHSASSWTFSMQCTMAYHLRSHMTNTHHRLQ